MKSPAARAARRASPGACLRRVRDFALVDGDAIVTREVADRALKLLDVDTIGLDQMDRRYLDMVARQFRRRPGRHRNHRRRSVRAARRHRGHYRALSAAAGFFKSHPARKNADAAWRSGIWASPSRREPPQMGLFSEDDV